MNNLALLAERAAERMAEAETKKERDYWSREYRRLMIQLTGDKGLFRNRKPKTLTSKPSLALQKTIGPCSCGHTNLRWHRRLKNYEPACTCNGSHIMESIYGLRRRKCTECGKDGSWQRVGPQVKFSCAACGKETMWHWANSEARDEWNDINNQENVEVKP